MKLDKVVAVKFLGIALSLGGMIASSWSGKKDTDKTLEKLVDQKLQNK